MTALHTGHVKASLLVQSWLAFLVCVGTPSAFAQSPASPLSPDEALAGLKTDTGLTIELAAAEPDVIDPVDIAFDTRGRMWVVQMGDYPNGPAEGEPGRSSIRVLTDRDGDGRFTDPVVFAEGLLFANSLMFWQDGVLVTTDGRLDFLADRDGDGQADFRETWFEGFSRENPQLRANSPTLGHDGLIYVANGLRGGKVRAVRKEWGEKEPVDISGRDFCFDPFTGDARAISGHGQFGMSFDDFGRRFCCSNRNPCIQVVIPELALEKNRDVSVTAVVADAAASGEASRIYPISKFWTTSNLHAGQFTAACGVHVYRGDALGPAYYGNVFTCDPTGNLIHRELLEGNDVVFKGRSPYEEREFLASEDTWFRPVNTETGPDGALYVVDMHRAVIEHPQFMPAELKDRPDLHLGNDRGRVYRLVNREAARPRESVPALHETRTADLVPWLDHPNVWQREMAFRLLIERQDTGAAPALEGLLKSARSPQGTCLALWGLADLKSLSRGRLMEVVATSSNPDVLQQCLTIESLSSHAAAPSEGPGAAERIVSSGRTLTPRLLFHVLLNLPPDKLASSAALLRGHLDDPWLTTAALLAAQDQIIPLAAGLVEHLEPSEVPAATSFVARVMPIVGGRARQDEIRQILEVAETLAARDPARTLETRSALWPVLAATLKSKGKGLSLIQEAAASAGINLDAIRSKALEVATAGSQSVSSRIAALRLLALSTFEAARPAIAECLAASDSAIVSAAVAVASTFSDAGVAPLLLEDYSARSPSVRREIQTAIFRSEPRIGVLLDEIDAGRIPATDLDQTRMQQLARLRNVELKARAAKLIAANRPADRTEVIERYKPALDRKGDPAHGRELFAKNCSQCHRIGDLGVNVAPDISDSRVKQPSQLLTDILDPNRAIDNNYFNYLVVDREGAIHSGVIATETSTSITLRQPEDKRVTIAREDVEQIRSTGQSLMPVGLEKALSVEDMSDLISFIKNWRYLDGEVPPEVIR